VFVWFNGFLCCSPDGAYDGDALYNSVIHIKIGCQPQQISSLQSTHATCSGRTDNLQAQTKNKMDTYFKFVISQI